MFGGQGNGRGTCYYHGFITSNVVLSFFSSACKERFKSSCMHAVLSLGIRDRSQKWLGMILRHGQHI